jgi:hypothetical protein
MLVGALERGGKFEPPSGEAKKNQALHVHVREDVDRVLKYSPPL